MKGSAFIMVPEQSEVIYFDIYTIFGVSFIKGSYLKLLNAASTKEYVKNDSRLEDGVRYLAKAAYAKANEKTVSVDILIEAESESDFIDKYEGFTYMISSGMFWLKIPSKHRILKLVYSNITPKTQFRNNRAIFTLTLIEPNPRDRIVI